MLANSSSPTSITHRFVPGFWVYCAGFTLLLGCEKCPEPSISPSVTQVYTVAGNGTAGYADGPSLASQFNDPRGVAVDAAGNIYVADTDNHSIRKIGANGQVTTLAGTGTAGFTEGTGTGAGFNYPYGEAVDGAGNVYVADAKNHMIRKITPTGQVTTLAGNGTAGNVDGPASIAQFNEPRGVALDAAGNIYVADTENHSIRKITAAGEVTTLAGKGAQFNEPRGIAVDASGTLYVADSFNNRICKITADGQVTTLAGGAKGGFKEGKGTEAQFKKPRGLAVDAKGKNIYVADTENHCIRRITSSGEVTTLAGKNPIGYTDGPATASQFNEPYGVAVNGKTLVVVDASNHCIRQIVLPPSANEVD
jgi:DNA-binding beta-propeller fold protein YncE